MSGGSLYYAYSKLDDIIDTVRDKTSRPLHRAFANHLAKVATALKELEWELSGDTGEGEADLYIEACFNKAAVLEVLIASVDQIKSDIQEFEKTLVKF